MCSTCLYYVVEVLNYVNWTYWRCALLWKLVERQVSFFEHISLKHLNILLTTFSYQARILNYFSPRWHAVFNLMTSWSMLLNFFLLIFFREVLEKIPVCSQVCAVGKNKNPQSYVLHKICQVHVDGKFTHCRCWNLFLWWYVLICVIMWVIVSCY